MWSSHLQTCYDGHKFLKKTSVNGYVEGIPLVTDAVRIPLYMLIILFNRQIHRRHCDVTLDNMRGSRGENYKDIGFLSNAGPDPLKIKK